VTALTALFTRTIEVRSELKHTVIANSKIMTIFSAPLHKKICQQIAQAYHHDENAAIMSVFLEWAVYGGYSPFVEIQRFF
jgi:hypothetical protein